MSRLLTRYGNDLIAAFFEWDLQQRVLFRIFTGFPYEKETIFSLDGLYNPIVAASISFLKRLYHKKGGWQKECVFCICD